MGSLSDFAGGNSMWWILILLLILNDGNGNTCDSLVWILLLSRFCGGESGLGCGCGATAARTCGCGCGV